MTQPPSMLPLSAEHRFRAHIAAAFAGMVALPLSVFFLPNAGSAIPFQIGVLLLVAALSMAAGFASVSASKSPLTVAGDLSSLIRCGTRAAILAATLAASMTVLGARIFNSQPAALVTVIPAFLAILPASFAGVIAAAIAAGIRFPQSSRSTVPNGNVRRAGTTVLFMIASAGGFISALFP